METYPEEKPLATVQQSQNFDRVPALVERWQHARKARGEVATNPYLVRIVVALV